MNNYKEGIGNRIKLVRQQLGLTQQQFAEKIGISRSHISNIENGNEMPSNSLVLLITAIFPVNHDWLLYEDGEILCSSEESENQVNNERLNQAINETKKICKTTDHWVREYLLDLLENELVLNQNCSKKTNDTMIVIADIIERLNQIIASTDDDKRKDLKYKLFQLIDEIYEMNK